MPTGIFERTEEYREKQRQAMLRRVNPGKNKTEETKRKIGDAAKGRRWTEEQREKMKGNKPPSRLGAKLTEEQRDKLKGEHNWNWKGGKETRSRREVLRRHNLTITEYEKLFREHNGVCAICGEKETFRKHLSIDHNHNCCNSKKTCGKCIRGLLCSRCNQMIGMARDNTKILKSAIIYLETK